MGHKLRIVRLIVAGILAVANLFMVVGNSPLLPARSSLTATSLLPLSRSAILARAKQLADHRWLCKEINRHPSCFGNKTYMSRWKTNETVTGLPYNWGGMDDVARFDSNLLQGKAAGSRKKDGIHYCTAGIDCSGFVSYCWGRPLTHEFTTSTIRQYIGAKPKYNWFTDMRAGDALVKPGSHIVLFAGYRSDGNPNVYEASGSKGRVVYNDWDTWSRYNGYFALQYKMLSGD